MDRKRILYCEGNSDGTIGGSYFSLLLLIEGLDSQEFLPEVVFFQDHTLVPRYRSAGARVHVFRKPRPFHVPFLAELRRNRVGRYLGMPLLVFQKSVNLVRGLLLPALTYARFLRAGRYDLVHLNNSIIRNQPWMLACRLARVPCVTHERGISPRYSWLSHTLGRRLRAVICISNAVRDNLVRAGVDPHNLLVIRNGLDPASMRVEKSPAQIREEHGIAPERPLIGMIGNIKEWKGQDTVVHAIAAIRHQMPDIACLLIGDTATSDSQFAERLRGLVAELGVGENIVFTGYRRNVADYMNALDVVVHASVEPEPFGRVLIEAMALGKPVVGANAGAVPEILDHGQAGKTFTPRDSNELAQVILSLLTERAAAARLAARGQRRVADEFHIRHNIEATHRLYRSILAKPLPLSGDRASA
jgi:glycosyltransferase involved in cell wall biosynthesis